MCMDEGGRTERREVFESEKLTKSRIEVGELLNVIVVVKEYVAGSSSRSSPARLRRKPLIQVLIGWRPLLRSM